MESATLVSRFAKHMRRLSKNPDRHFLADEDPIMSVYGTDEFKLDRVKGSVFLRGIGSVSCPQLVGFRGEPEWVGVIGGYGQWDIRMGFGNPFTTGTPAAPAALSVESALKMFGHET